MLAELVEPQQDKLGWRWRGPAPRTSKEGQVAVHWDEAGDDRLSIVALSMARGRGWRTGNVGLLLAGTSTSRGEQRAQACGKHQSREREEEKKHAGERRAGDATEWGNAW
jgi:hypothetical protein